MEPHAIPQDVTSFQFHLVGDMTLKQFMYLAIGSVIAYVLFVFFAATYPLVVWPVIVISTLSGVAFAFLPIGSRPLDYWLGAFLRAIYSPTKRIWKKDKKTFKEDVLFNSRLVTYLSSLQPKIPEPTKITAQSTTVPTTPITQTVQSQVTPTTDELGKTVDLARQAQNLQLKIIQTERVLNQIQSQASQHAIVPADYSQQVNKIMVDLQNLINQASQVRQQLDFVTSGQQPKLENVISSVHLPERVKVVNLPKTKQTQLALTTFPNVISGIIKDPSGNYLEGCIAVIHDKEGLPVRALKSNKLGQFTGSTPLPNGTYKLLIEKDNYTFDVLQMELTGELLPTLMITSK